MVTHITIPTTQPTTTPTTLEDEPSLSVCVLTVVCIVVAVVDICGEMVDWVDVEVTGFEVIELTAIELVDSTREK